MKGSISPAKSSAIDKQIDARSSFSDNADAITIIISVPESQIYF